MSLSVDSSIRTFCKEQKEWLTLELESEQGESTSQSPNKKNSNSSSNNNNNKDDGDVQRSHVLRHLEIADVSVGLYGRTVVRFTSMKQAPSASSTTASIGGAVTSTAAEAKGDQLLPAHRFTTGDEVEIRSKQQKQTVGGVISEVSETSLSVALFSSSSRNNNSNKNGGSNNNKKSVDGAGNAAAAENSDNYDSIIVGMVPPLSLLPKSSIQVHQKYIAALDNLERLGTSHPIAGRVVQHLMSYMPQAPPPQRQTESESGLIFNAYLDQSQKDAISFCLSDNRPVSLIHGPPGTGKTTTLVELIQVAVRTFGYKVLVTAPSNVAVDNVLARLVVKPSTTAEAETKKSKKQQRKAVSSSTVAASALSPLKVVRLGHPARLQPEILTYSLEALVQRADGTEIVADVRKELDSFLKLMTNPKSNSSAKRLAYKEIKALRSEIRSREQKVVKQLLSSAQVVLATCVGAASSLIQSTDFDLVVIDEAAQALEAACWIPALKGKKLVLAGDHCQLPPTIKNNNPNVQRALSCTMFERAMQLYGDDKLHATGNHDNADSVNVTVSQTPEMKPLGLISRMLQVQYRMHQNIADWASHALYGGRLETHESVKARLLEELTKQTDSFGICRMPLLLIDTAGCEMHESLHSSGSRTNQGEAMIVERHIRTLINVLHVQQNQIAVITPYNGQVEVLRAALLPEYPKLEIRSVDGFQGGEREAVVLSLVRSSPGAQDGIGFLSSERRLNVAVTRAKRHACVICDSDTVGKNKFIRNLLSWIEERGEQQSALEYLSCASSSALDGDDGGLQADLLQVEMDMERLSRDFSTGEGRKAKGMPARELTEAETEENRKEIIAKIEAFVKTAKPGGKMSFSKELSKGDRKLVHEEAERLGIGHASEGVEGINRRIKLFIDYPKKKVSPSASSNGVAAAPTDSVADRAVSQIVQGGEGIMAEGADVTDSDRENDDTEEGNDTAPPPAAAPSSFVALEEDEESDEEVEPSTEELSTNNLLAQLAKERAERNAQRSKSSQVKPTAPAKNQKKTKAQKLGGAKKPSPAAPKNDGLEGLDDMAFLDAQIEKVQTAHGRKVDGKGSYRTVVNGILTAKPAPQQAKRDARSSAALQSKLKEAQNDRKAKVKKK